MPKAKSTHDWRETRRLRAWELHQLGWTQVRIAEALGVSQGAVSQWFKRIHDGGSIEALHRHPAPGRQASLTDEQFAQIPALMARGASAFGFQGDHWTIRRVATMLNQVFGVSYHPGHVSRILQKYCPDWRDQK
jgi:transposase